MYIYIYIYIFIYTRVGRALRARIGPWALVGPFLGAPLGPGLSPGLPLGPPRGSSDALRAGELDPSGVSPEPWWSHVEPCGGRGP